MKRMFLLAVVLAACGPEEAMARVAPRAAGAVFKSKGQERINDQRTAASQNAVYQPDAFVRPATMDPAAAERYTITATGTAGSWVLTRLKGVTSRETYKSVEFFATNGSGSDAKFCVAICSYEEMQSGVVFREITRAVTYIPSPVVTQKNTAEFASAVTVSPENKYAIAVFIESGAAGAGFYMAPESAAGQPILWGGGMSPSRSADDRVDFSTNEADARIRTAVTSADSTAVPYVALVRGFSTDAWY